MTKLEEIKQRHSNYTNSIGEQRVDAWEVMQEHCEDDIEYLLSKVDNLEIFFKTIADQTLAVYNDIVSLTKKLEIAEKAIEQLGRMDDPRKIEEFADQALAEIRQ